VSISGDTSVVPTKIVRKQASKRKAIRADGVPQRNVLKSGYIIESVGDGDYYGFTLDGDGLYLMGDFTVTHNSGKGYALENVPQAKELASKAAVVWDSAGDQNSTENAWILSEAEKRGLKVTYAFVHADPKVQWADPKMGVVKRANNPKNGRMVDAAVFADSYAQGAKNHHAFHQAHKNNPNAQFVFMKNGKTPQLVDGVPQEALAIDRDELYHFAMDTISKMDDLPPTLKRGAQAGARIWQKPQKAGESLARKGKTMRTFEQQQFPGPAPAAQAPTNAPQKSPVAAPAPAAPVEDDGWGDALSSWYDQEDERRESMGAYFRGKGYVTPSGAALPQLNPDGTLAAQAAPPAQAPSQ
jgi:hypothetical protein